MAEHALEDPDPARQRQGADILASFFEPTGEFSGAEDFIIFLVGRSVSQLPPFVLERALAWLEKQEIAPIDLLSTIRAKVYPSEPGRWMTKSDQDRLVEAMENNKKSIRKRADAAYRLLGLLPMDEVHVRRRAAELLDTWIDSPEIPPEIRPSYQHDLGVAMRMIARDDETWLERAARHLKAAYEALRPTPSGSVTAESYARTLLALLESRAVLSSPNLIALAAPIDILAAEIRPDVGRELRLAAASQLLQANMLAHPVCLEGAALLIKHVLEERPSDPDAHRMLYWHAKIRYDQGFLERKQLDRVLERARGHPCSSPAGCG